MTDQERLVELAEAVIAADIHCGEMVRANKIASYILGQKYGRTERAHRRQHKSSILDNRPNSSDFTPESLMKLEQEEETLPAEEVFEELEREFPD